MKMHITRKKLFEFFSPENVFSSGYCTLQFLFYDLTPAFYNAGAYGWNCDVYVIEENVCVVTGYRTFGKKIPRNIAKKYDDAAKKIVEERPDDVYALLTELRKKFINEIKK